MAGRGPSILAADLSHPGRFDGITSGRCGAFIIAFERLEHFVLENQKMLAEDEIARKRLH